MKEEEIPEVPVEEVKKEYTKEEIAQMDAFFDAMLYKKILPRIREVYKYMLLAKKTLDDIYHDLDLKRCGLSKSNREFLQSFDRPFIEKSLKDYIKKIRGYGS